MKRFIDTPFIVIFCLGLILIISSLGIKSIIPDLPSFWEKIISVVGVAFLAVALTAPISEYFQYKTLSEHIKLVQGAQKAGVVHIFESRKKDKDMYNKFLNDAFDRANNILFAAIALPAVYNDRPYEDKIEEKMFNSDTKIKILLLNPEGQSATNRADIEKGRNTIGQIDTTLHTLRQSIMGRIKELEIKLDNLKSLNADNLDEEIEKIIKEKIRLEIHLYDFPPIAYMFMTEDTLLLEQYHFGRLDSDPIGTCIGSNSVVLQMKPHCETYERMKKHFFYIWENESVDVTGELIKKIINESNTP